MIDSRCPHCNALLLKSSASGGSIQVECRRHRCRRLVTFMLGSTGLPLWDARCYQCSRLLYRYTAKLAGEVEVKCPSCRSLDTKRMRIPVFSTG